MEMLNQPVNGQLGARLVETLDSGEHQQLDVVVAFAKNSGVLRIKDAIDRFRSKGGVVNVYLGIDFQGTSFEALTNLLNCTDSLYVIHMEGTLTFHPKIYCFRGDDQITTIVGSNNLTGGGLWTNFESSLVSTEPVREKREMIHNAVEEYIASLAALGNSIQEIQNQETIERLLQHGYIQKEVSEQINRSITKRTNQRTITLFERGKKPRLPRIQQSTHGKSAPTTASPSNTSPDVSAADDAATIWFETRRLTGGSRNILDLSSKSRVEKGDATNTIYELASDPGFIRGGVAFFGVDPTNTGSTQLITINFKGIDYFGNTILYPQGEKANRTWRLQIRGTDTNGRPITDALRGDNGEPLLVQKIVTFTKVTKDYYYMTVFPASDLEEFRDASWLTARNGANAHSKLMGMI